MIALRLLLLEKDSDSAVGYLHLEKELGDHDKMGGMTPIVDKWKSKSSYLPLLPHLPHYPLITPLILPTTFHVLSPHTYHKSPYYLLHVPFIATTLHTYHTYLLHRPHTYRTSYLPYHPPHTFDTSFLPHLIHHPLIPTTPSPS